MTDSLTEAELFELLSLECCVDCNGTIRYYNKQGQMHRVWGPAVKYAYGTQVWYQNGKPHRVGGPAVVNADGGRVWYQDGLLHRLDGPAVISVEGGQSWYINGKELTETEWLQVVASMENV